MSTQQQETVKESGMVWGFLPTFLAYLERVHGTQELHPRTGIVGDNQFFFEYGGDSPEGALDGEVSFMGGVTFTGHHGMLRVSLREPRILFQGASSALSMVTSSGRQTIATLGEPEIYSKGLIQAAIFRAPGLTEEGVEVLGGVYPIGQLCEPIFIRIQQGADVPQV